MKPASPDLPSRWLPRALFWLNLLLAGALVALVVLAPVLGAYANVRLLTLFAHDATLRRTALASAIGLAVTAWVFFRPAGGASAQVKAPRLPPSNVIGA